MGSLADRGIEAKKERSLGIWMDRKILADIHLTLDYLKRQIVSSYVDIYHPTNLNIAMLDDLYAVLAEAEKDNNKEASENGRKKTKGLPAK